MRGNARVKDISDGRRQVGAHASAQIRNHQLESARRPGDEDRLLGHGEMRRGRNDERQDRQARGSVKSKKRQTKRNMTS